MPKAASSTGRSEVLAPFLDFDVQRFVTVTSSHDDDWQGTVWREGLARENPALRLPFHCIGVWAAKALRAGTCCRPSPIFIAVVDDVGRPRERDQECVQQFEAAPVVLHEWGEAGDLTASCFLPAGVRGVGAEKVAPLVFARRRQRQTSATAQTEGPAGRAGNVRVFWRIASMYRFALLALQRQKQTRVDTRSATHA